MQSVCKCTSGAKHSCLCPMSADWLQTRYVFKDDEEGGKGNYRQLEGNK